MAVRARISSITGRTEAGAGAVAVVAQQLLQVALAGGGAPCLLQGLADVRQVLQAHLRRPQRVGICQLTVVTLKVLLSSRRRVELVAQARCRYLEQRRPGRDRFARIAADELGELVSRRGRSKLIMMSASSTADLCSWMVSVAVPAGPHSGECRFVPTPKPVSSKARACPRDSIAAERCCGGGVSRLDSSAGVGRRRQRNNTTSQGRQTRSAEQVGVAAPAFSAASAGRFRRGDRLSPAAGARRGLRQPGRLRRQGRPAS